MAPWLPPPAGAGDAKKNSHDMARLMFSASARFSSVRVRMGTRVMAKVAGELRTGQQLTGSVQADET